MSDEESRTAGYSRAEWTSLSIQERIRAMNESIPDPKTNNHLKSLSNNSSSTEAASTEAAEEEPPVEEEEEPIEHVVPKRSSVVDIWRKRDTKEEETVPKWKKQKSPLSREEVPKQSSAANTTWTQRQQQEAEPVENDESLPAWKKREQQTATPPVVDNGATEVISSLNHSSVAGFWNQKQQKATAVAEEPKVPLWKKRDPKSSTVVSPPVVEQQQQEEEEGKETFPKRSSVTNFWKQKQQGGEEQQVPSWKKREQQQSTSPVESVRRDSEEENSPPQRSSVANIWKQREKEETPSSSAPASWKKPTSPVDPANDNDAQDKVSPPKRSSVKDIWSHRQKPSQEEAPVPSWKKPTTSPVEPPLSEDNVSHSKRSSVKDIWSQRQKASPEESNAIPSWKKREHPKPTEPKDTEISPAKRSSVKDIWNQRQQGDVVVPSWKKRVDIWNKRGGEASTTTPKASTSRKAAQTPSPSRSWKSGHSQSPGSPWQVGLSPVSPATSATAPSWKKAQTPPSLPPKAPAPWVKEEVAESTTETKVNAEVVNDEEESTPAQVEPALHCQSPGSPWKVGLSPVSPATSATAPSWRKTQNPPSLPPKAPVVAPWVKDEVAESTTETKVHSEVNDEEVRPAAQVEPSPKREVVVPSWKSREARSKPVATKDPVTAPWVREKNVTSGEEAVVESGAPEDSGEATPKRSSVKDIWKSRESTTPASESKSSVERSPSTPAPSPSRANFKQWLQRKQKAGALVSGQIGADEDPVPDDEKMEDTSMEANRSPWSPPTTKTPSFKGDTLAPRVKPKSPTKPITKPINGVKDLSGVSSLAASYSSPSKGTPRLGVSPLDSATQRSPAAAAKPVSEGSTVESTEETTSKVDSLDENKAGHIVPSSNRSLGSPDKKKMLREQRQRMKKNHTDICDDASELSEAIDSVVSNALSRSNPSGNSSFDNNEPIPQLVKNLIDNIAAETNNTSLLSDTIPENQDFQEDGSPSLPTEIRAKTKKKKNDSEGVKAAEPMYSSSCFDEGKEGELVTVVKTEVSPDVPSKRNLDPIRPAPIRVNRYQHNKFLAARAGSKSTMSETGHGDSDFSIFSFGASPSAKSDSYAGFDNTSPKSTGSINVSALASRASKVLKNRRRTKERQNMGKEEQDMARDLARKVIRGSSSRFDAPEDEQRIESKDDWEAFDSDGPWGSARLGRSVPKSENVVASMKPPVVESSREQESSVRRKKPPTGIKQEPVHVSERALMQPSEMYHSANSPSTLTMERPSFGSRYHTSDRFIDAVNNMVDEAKKTFNLVDQEKRTFSFGSEGTDSSYHRSDGGSYLETPSIGPAPSESTDGNSHFSMRTPKLRVNEGIVASGFVKESTANMDALQSAYKTTNLKSIAAETLADMSDGVHDSLNAMRNSLKLEEVAKDIQKFLPSELTPTNSSGESPKTSNRQSLKLPEQLPDSPKEDTDIAIEVEYYEEATTPERKASRFPFGRSNNKKGVKKGRKPSAEQVPAKSESAFANASSTSRTAYV